MDAHVKRYSLHFGGAMVAYTLVLIASIGILDGMELAQWQRAVLAALPVVPGLYALHAVLVFYWSRDEFQRRIISESMLISALLTGFACFAYGFIEGAVELPEVSLIWVLPAMVGLWGLIAAILRWHYR